MNVYFLSAIFPFVVSARLLRNDWNISVGISISTPVLRGISATTSSFIYEGTLSWYWRDDSLRKNYEIGDLIDSAYGPGPSLYATYNNTNRPQVTAAEVAACSSACPVVNPGTDVCGPAAAPAQCSGPGQSPWFTRAWRSRVVAVDPATTALNTVATVQYAPPAWAGVTLSPADSLVAAYVVGSEVFSNTFGQAQQLANFPFDVQTLAWSVDLAGFGTTDMVLVLPTAMASGAAVALPAGTPDGYTVTASSAAVTAVPSAFGQTSRLTVAYTMARNPAFFINRFILPLCLLFVVTPLSVAMMPPTPGRFIPVTSFAITVSFVFVAGQSVPILPYTTRLDKFFLLCFFTAALCLFYTFVIFCRTERSKKSIQETLKRNGGTFRCCPQRAQAPAPAHAHAEKAAVAIELAATTGVTTADATKAPPPGVAVAPAAVAAAAPAPKASLPKDCCSIYLADELDRTDAIFATAMITGFAIATAIICAAPGV